MFRNICSAGVVLAHESMTSERRYKVEPRTWSPRCRLFEINRRRLMNGKVVSLKRDSEDVGEC